MKTIGKLFAFVGALALIPTLALAQTRPAATPPAKSVASPAKTAATHSTNGILKSSDATSLVIVKTAKDTKTTTFTINAATVTKGTLTPGAHLQVRYHQQGALNIATAITVAPAKSSPKSGK